MNTLQISHSLIKNANRNKNYFLQSVFNHDIKSDIAVMNALIEYDRKYAIIFSGQKILGAIAGYSRKTANESVGRLAALGWITKKYIHRHACIYTVNQLFYEFAERIKYRFNSLRKLSLKLWYSMCQSEKVTPIRMNNLDLNYPPRVVRDCAREIVQSVYFPRFITIPLRKRTKRIVVNEAGDLVISDCLRRITELLQLTRLGQISLMAFPDEAIEFAFETIKVPYFFESYFELWDAANAYCSEKNLLVNHALCSIIKKRYLGKSSGENLKLGHRPKDEKTGGSFKGKNLEVDQTQKAEDNAAWSTNRSQTNYGPKTNYGLRSGSSVKSQVDNSLEMYPTQKTVFTVFKEECPTKLFIYLTTQYDHWQSVYNSGELAKAERVLGLKLVNPFKVQLEAMGVEFNQVL